MFKCELCDKEVKHTRNIIGAHMKMVHLISWREYQEILVKLRQVWSVAQFFILLFLPQREVFSNICKEKGEDKVSSRNATSLKNK